MLYANVSTGFTPGGFSTAATALNPGVLQPAAPFQPVELKAYTTGIKNRVLDNRLTLNLEGFYYDYKNYQVSARDVTTGQSLVYNAAKATVYGVQTDARIAIRENDDLALGTTWLQAVANQLVAGPGNYDDYTLPFSPKWTGNLFYQHAFDVDSRGGQVRGNVNFQYTSGRWEIYSHAPGFYQGGNPHTDLTLGYYAPHDLWYVQGFVRNLENNLVKQSCGTVLPPSEAGCTFEPPRTYGAQVGFKF
jgi:iron complex outermembrane receptor protein